MVRRSLSRWIVWGIALDALASALLWLAQIAWGPATTLGSCWPSATGFAAIPWIVHVALLPRLLHMPGARASAAALTPVYTAGAALLMPVVGFAAMLSSALVAMVGVPFWLGATALARLYGPRAESLVGDGLANAALIAWGPGLVGLAAGALGHYLRSQAGQPGASLRADMVGGYAAAVIGFSALALANASGMFDGFPELGAAFRLFALKVWLPLAVPAGALAYLPHLVLTGRAVFNPRPATSACGAAPSAPSR